MTAAITGPGKTFAGPPPSRAGLGVDPAQADPTWDARRIEWGWRLWKGQTAALMPHDQAIEESVRMLSGQQWLAWNPMLGQYQDVSEWFVDDERKWRQRPVLNRLLPWFMLTHSRMTENPPIVTFLAGPDHVDQMLAEAMDPIHKALWREMGMIDVMDRMHSWLIPAGRAHLQTLVDLGRGRMIPRQATAPVPMFDEFDEPMMDQRTGNVQTMDVPNMPLDNNYEPLAVIRAGQLMPTGGEQAYDREGSLRMEVLSPLQVRGTWGAHIPWHEKPRHQVLNFLPIEEVWELYGVMVEPDVKGMTLGIEDSGYIERTIFGGGHFGAAGQRFGADGNGAMVQTEGYAKVLTTWCRPTADEGPDGRYKGQVETQSSPGGRLLITTPTQVLFDGARPAKFPHGSPIRTFEFVRLPGRPSGTSPQEAMNPLQRSYNRGWGQVNEHTNLVANPIGFFDKQSGIRDGDWTNAPGLRLGVNMRQGVTPIGFVNPPQLGLDTFKRLQLLLGELEYYGGLEGARGSVDTEDPSGELVRELRANSDRPYGATARRSVEECGRMIQDWMAWIPVVWPQGKILSYAGTDNIARTIVVLPMMFEEGLCHVVPDVESMVPEGAAGREARVDKLYDRGLLGLPGSPQALDNYYDMSRFPNMGRAGKFGGVDRTTAEQENGKLVQGAPAQAIPLFPWYDDVVHLMVHEQFMKAPEFLTMDMKVQAQFALHWQVHMMRARAQAAAQQAAAAQQQGQGGPPKGPPNGNQGGPPKPPAQIGAGAPAGPDNSTGG